MDNLTKLPTLYLVVPCYNESETLPLTIDCLLELYSDLMANAISYDSRIVFVNDGSKDDTWNIISRACEDNHIFCGINLSRNVGHQNAVLAGLMSIRDRCDISITIDADLQDDVSVIAKMIDLYKQGNEVVYGIRNDRKSDSFFKRFTAQAYYKFLNFLGIEIMYNHADFRLMSKVILDKLSEFEETNLFLRGLIPLIGYKHDCVYYSRKPRTAGESKYNMHKMLTLAIDGVTSFSVKPLKFVGRIGVVLCMVAAVMFFYAIFSKLKDKTVDGWTSLMCSIWFLGGVQLIGLNIVGEYVGKIYSEVKHRPRYIIAESVNMNDDVDEKDVGE